MMLTFKTRGFTLVELLVVITITMLGLSLVGSIGTNMVDKARAQTEFIQFQNTLKKASQTAFLNATPVRIDIFSKEIQIQQADLGSQTITYQYLEFLNSDAFIIFNENGISPTVHLQIKVNQRSVDYKVSSQW